MTRPNQQRQQRLLELVDTITVWQRVGVRAPHKPLFLLRVLAHYCEDPYGSVRFRDIEGELSGLLEKYGPLRSSVHPEYPFWRLQNDGLWEVTADGVLERRTGHDDPRLSALRAMDARGNFPMWMIEAFREAPALVTEVARRVLNAHFPRELHDSLLRDTGLYRHVPAMTVPMNLAGHLWNEALEAYNYRCAISGMGCRLGAESYCVAPVLIRWPQAGGHFTLSNLLVLSSLHCELFLAGLLTITPNLRVKIASNLEMSPATESLLGRSIDREIAVPAATAARPAPQNLMWHNNQVFRGRLEA